MGGVIDGLANVWNTRNTERKQDAALAQEIRDQARYQQQADAKVNEEVGRLQTSTADASRRKALDSYQQALIANKRKIDAGLTPAIGGQAFKADAASAAQGVDQYGQTNADLMSRTDAPDMQRQQEAFGYGNLATDLGLIDRQAKGQDFIDQLRLRSIRRNPWVDAFSAIDQAGTRAAVSGGG